MAESTPSTDVDISNIDLYEFMSIDAQATASEIKRAGRKTSLLYHPDKVAPTPENLQKFHILQIAIGILSDPAEKSKYDQTRGAKLRRKAEVNALDARKRKMREDLENRESSAGDVGSASGQKRTFSEREMKMRRIQEENRRKIEEMKARKQFEAEQIAAQERAKSTKDTPTTSSGPESTHDAPNGKSIEPDSMGRAIKLRWHREGEGQCYEEGAIGEMFNDVENVIILKDKKRKMEGKSVVMGTCVVVFTSLDAATKVMSARATLLAKFDSVEWAKGKKDDPT